MSRTSTLTVLTALLIAALACSIPTRMEDASVGEIGGEIALDMQETMTARAQDSNESDSSEETAAAESAGPTATPTPAAEAFPQTIEDAEDDLLVECDGEPSPGAGPAWADVVEVTRISANVFEVTFRGEARPQVEAILADDGEEVPEHLGVSLIVETPEDEYIQYAVDWYSYYPQGEREDVHESAPDAAFKSLFNPLFEWIDARTLRITLEPESEDELAAEAQFRIHASVDLAGAEPPYACDRAPERN